MKNFILYSTLCISLLAGSPRQANANLTTVTGYTSGGVYYEAITLENNFNSSIIPMADTISLTKEITYNDIITPSISLPWTEIVNGATFSGTLYLQSFYYSDGKTFVTYKGTLTAQ